MIAVCRKTGAAICVSHDLCETCQPIFNRMTERAVNAPPPTAEQVAAQRARAAERAAIKHLT